MVPTPDDIDDLVRIGGPSERLGLGYVVLDEEAVDGCLQVDEGMEDAAFELPLGQLCEEPLDHCLAVHVYMHERGR